MVEAAGIEPVRSINSNLLMACDFGRYDLETIELPSRFESPPVPCSPPQSWRYIGDDN